MSELVPDRYELVIGLEVHARLRTLSKMFCACSAAFDAPPNSNVCPTCLGLPGGLPRVNQEAVRLATRAALALACQVNYISQFERKNYFYPDMTKGYQISQYRRPLAQAGELVFDHPHAQTAIGIERIQIEEDAGRSIHKPREGVSLIDFNRCGVPLIEIVSRPEVRSPEQAAAYLKSMRALLVGIEVCDGRMQEGSFRCDANLSLRLRGSKKLGTRTEMKNLNSFKFVRQALEYEARRQARVLDDGGEVIQETRLFDRRAGVTRALRSKAAEVDYRYFPEPDLPLLQISEGWLAAEREWLRENKRKQSEKLARDLAVDSQAERVSPSKPNPDLISDRLELESFIDEVLAQHPDEVARYRKGKSGLVHFFVGRVMQATSGNAEPGLLNELLLQKLRD